MNWWSKIAARLVFAFAGWDGVISFVLSYFNGFLQDGVTADRVAKVYMVAMDVLYYLKKYRVYVPNVWLDYFDPTVAAVETFVVIFEDGKVEAGEVARAVEAFEKAYAAWRS
jgi:hypothetical protein